MLLFKKYYNILYQLVIIKLLIIKSLQNIETVKWHKSSHNTHMQIYSISL
jgi:hypothetical protein